MENKKERLFLYVKLLMFRTLGVKQVNISKNPDLNVKSFWRHKVRTPHYFEYFPDYKDSQLSVRTYMFNMLFIIDPDFVISKVKRSNKKRDVVTMETEGEHIFIKKELLQEIEEWKMKQIEEFEM